MRLLLPQADSINRGESAYYWVRVLCYRYKFKPTTAARPAQSSKG